MVASFSTSREGRAAIRRHRTAAARDRKSAPPVRHRAGSSRPRALHPHFARMSLQHVELMVRVEMIDRLIEQHHVRILCQQRRNGDAAALAAGKRRDIARLEIAQSDGRQRRARDDDDRRRFPIARNRCADAGRSAPSRARVEGNGSSVVCVSRPTLRASARRGHCVRALRPSSVTLPAAAHAGRQACAASASCRRRCSRARRSPSRVRACRSSSTHERAARRRSTSELWQRMQVRRAWSSCQRHSSLAPADFGRGACTDRRPAATTPESRAAVRAPECGLPSTRRILRIARLAMRFCISVRKQRLIRSQVVLVGRAERMQQFMRDDVSFEPAMRRSANTFTMPNRPFCRPMECGSAGDALRIVIQHEQLDVRRRAVGGSGTAPCPVARPQAPRDDAAACRIRGQYRRQLDASAAPREKRTGAIQRDAVLPACARRRTLPARGSHRCSSALHVMRSVLGAVAVDRIHRDAQRDVPVGRVNAVEVGVECDEQQDQQQNSDAKSCATCRQGYRQRGRVASDQLAASTWTSASSPSCGGVRDGHRLAADRAVFDVALRLTERSTAA